MAKLLRPKPWLSPQVSEGTTRGATIAFDFVSSDLFCPLVRALSLLGMAEGDAHDSLQGDAAIQATNDARAAASTSSHNIREAAASPCHGPAPATGNTSNNAATCVNRNTQVAAAKAAQPTGIAATTKPGASAARRACV